VEIGYSKQLLAVRLLFDHPKPHEGEAFDVWTREITYYLISTYFRKKGNLRDCLAVYRLFNKGSLLKD
jgi:hypothetical protein